MTTRDLARVALFAAVTAALGLIPPLVVPVVPVPITAQTLGLMLAGAILGARKAAASQAVFVVLVAAGLPFLAGGRGGLGVLLGPSGGFVLAFPIGAFAVGWITERWWDRYSLWRAGVATILGGVIFGRGSGGVWGPVFGVGAFALLFALLTIYGVQQPGKLVIQGGIIALAAIIYGLKRR